MQFLKQSTASQSVLLGPFLDSTDGVTAETALTINASDIRLSKNGGNMAAKNSGGGTHDENGWYTITLNATDTNTVGRLQVSCTVSGALPVFAEYQVVEEDVYDALFGSSATLASNISSIVADTNELQTDWVNGGRLDLILDSILVDTGALETRLTAARASDMDHLQWLDIGEFVASQDSVNTLTTNLATVDSVVDAILVDTGTTIPAQITALNDLDSTAVQSAANAALVALHLDHLFAADYDPASKPGVATALLNELIENDGGLSRFTANAIELAPSGGGGGGNPTPYSLTHQRTLEVLIDALLSPSTGAGTGTETVQKYDNSGESFTVTTSNRGNRISVNINA